jgi:Cu(I)/Ag(I) efflux system membrane fusion protein
MTGHEGHLEAESLAIKNESTQMEEMKFPEAFQKNFSEAIIPYFKMKDAFIASDIVQVVSFANSTTNSFKSLITQDLGEAEKTYLKKILVLLNLIATENNLKNQREFFVQLNEYIVAIVKNIKSPTQLLYIQKCPMANNNKGAIWLSREEEIKNPYFGDLMLSCGEIQDIIKINI